MGLGGLGGVGGARGVKGGSCIELRARIEKSNIFSSKGGGGLGHLGKITKQIITCPLSQR